MSLTNYLLSIDCATVTFSFLRDQGILRGMGQDFSAFIASIVACESKAHCGFGPGSLCQVLTVSWVMLLSVKHD